jgi:hypothetical protein
MAGSGPDAASPARLASAITFLLLDPLGGHRAILTAEDIAAVAVDYPEWQTETPTEDLQIAGGNIWSIALAAAVFAADEGSPVRMAHIERAARAEYAKLGRSRTDAELRGWPRERRGAP